MVKTNWKALSMGLFTILVLLGGLFFVANTFSSPVSAAQEVLPKESLPTAEPQPVSKAGVEEIPAEFLEMDEWIIKWKSGTVLPTSAAQFEILTLEEEHHLMLIRLAKDVDIKAWYTEWVKKPEIEYLEPNFTMKISTRPNDPQLSKQTYLNQINVFDGWKVATGNTDIVIAILDTGVDLGHPNLKANLVPGVNLVDRSKTPQDDNGHGTQIAGVLGAQGNNNLGIAGVLWSAKMMPIKVLDHKGEGTPFRVSQGIYQSLEKGASIVLLSLGDPVFSQTLKDAVEAAEKKGVLVVAATGNEGARVNYPAAFPTVLAVGAVNENDRAVAYSNAGPEVQVVAPGTVYTTRLGGGYGSHSGTSMAAPQVAGLAALIWSRYPNLKPVELRNHIIYTSKDVSGKGWNPQTGHGRIDVGKALTTKPVANIYETNHLVSQAAPFPIETMIRSELRNKQSVAWYKLDSPYRGTVLLNVLLDTAKTNGVDITFYPNGPNGQSFLYNVKKEREISLTVPKGISYLKVKYNHQERRATPLGYELTQSFIIYADGQQPNGSKGQATMLKAKGETITGTFYRDYQNHWYYIDVPKRGFLDLQITVDTIRLDPVIHWERPDGKVQKIDEGTIDNRQEERLQSEVQPGRHYFKISNYYGHRVNGEYYLRASYTPLVEDSYEPNNSIQQAAPIQVGQVVEATIAPVNDVDWFRLQVPEGRYVQLEALSLPAQMGVETVLLDSKQQIVFSRKQVGNEHGYVLGDKVSAGTYYVRVRADSEFPFHSYKFRVNAVELLFGFRDISGHWAVVDIVEATHKGWIQGVGDYRFAPNESMNRAAVATILQRIYTYPQGNGRFKDVPPTHWAQGAVASIQSSGVMSGYPDGTFRPEKSITRAEVAVIVDRLLDHEKVVTSAQTYRDLAANHWATDSIKRLSAQGLLAGYEDGTFRPDKAMSRAEFVTLMARLNKR